MTDPHISSNSKESATSSTMATTSKPTNTPKRPRLGYLRSAWTTTDLYYASSFNSTLSKTSSMPENEQEGQEEAQEEEDFYSIKLPTIQLHDYEDETAQEQEKDEIIQEIFRMITVANVLCLSGSVVECGLVMHGMPGSFNQVIEHYQDWMPYAILPLYTLWWLFMILVLKNRTEHLRQYLNWTQASAIVMASTNFMLPTQQLQQRFYPLFQQQFHTLFVALAILASFIFAFAKRILMANERKQERLKSRVTREHERLQACLDQHTLAFSHHRLAFLNTVSQEIQDVALMVITTLEQFSPASILSNTHELLSACSLAVPIASISAINTTIRQVCHVSSHLELLSKLTVQAWASTTTSTVTAGRTAPLQLPELNKAEFDIGDLLQNIGDALAGVASKLDVNFVIYHCDNNLHHTLVIGDEGAIRHALLNHLRNVLECCTPGACIEVGLNVTDTAKDDECKITFCITHTSSPAIRNASAALLPNANLTAQLLQYIHAHCTVSDDDSCATDDSAHTNSSNQTKFEFSFDLARGNNNSTKRDNNRMFITKDSYLLKSHYANIKFANEPSLKDLAKFIQHLKGLKMVLHAPEQSIFAKHLTSCLASWNTDISHVPVAQRTAANMGIAASSALDSSSSASSSCVSSAATTPLVVDPATDAPQQQPVHPRQPSTPPVPSPAIEEEHIHSIPPAFILIDDDVATLESKLAEFRSQPAASANVLQAHHGGRRAAAAAAAAAAGHHHPHHTKKSSTSSPQNFFHQGTTAIIHFTSLTKYKAVRDTIQCYAFLPSRDPFSMPRVVVVPKPAGPRRFLTALHTAWHNSVVEPHFSAIATSPSSPMPPVISMLVQREMAAAVAAQKGHGNVTSPNEASSNSRISPNDISPGGNSHRSNRRPLSGLFSPPPNLPSPSSSTAAAASSTSPSIPPPANGDTYFTSQRQQQHQDQQLTTPPIHTSASGTGGSNSRRRSANAQQEQDYLTAKPTTPLMSALGAVSTSTTSPAAAIAAASIAAAAAAAGLQNEHMAMNSNSSGNTLDTTSTESPSIALPAVATVVDSIVTDSANSGEQTSATANSTDTSNGDHPIIAETAKPKKILSKTMTNFKLNKKKKKAKGTPFADVVSPPINVLIVEDNIINQAILSAWMKKHKIKFSVASNGKEAVDKWKTGGFHLVLMDIQLPVMNGIEATKMIRSIEKEQQIGVLPMSSSFLRQQQQQEQQLQQEPLEVVAAAAAIATAAVNEMKLQESNNTSSKNDDKPSIFRSPVIIVALTASSLESDRHAALAAGCNDFLTKPVSLEWLEKKIIEWGCMQALIDFEGWRRWKRNTNTSDEKVKLTPASVSNTAAVNNEQFEAEKKRIEALSKKKNVPGVLLPGVSNLTKNARRSTVVSQMDDTKRRKKPTLKPSKSDSDTQHVQSSSSSSSRMMKCNQHNTKSQSETTSTTTATGSVSLNRSRSTSRERKSDNDN
ncbi:hypothetical protein MAM1_0014d01383 [Mucor ambiguus]|uniref:Response regulatory domain-containing protein n=1 Tax=Mucor ambiguus TaxID=91626 RepID=A0A0C9M100_9FUNG|nr:hypothetical protein MAM1_0014d01383 [Mucor ambiguus]